MRRFLLWILALAVLAPLNGCTPEAKAEVPKTLAVTVVRHAGAAWVVGTWTNGTVTDGKGALDAILTYNKVEGGDSTGHTLSPTATKDSFPITATPAVPMSGTLCVRAKRRALLSPVTTSSCKAWSYTEADTPPPGPVVDSAFVRHALLDSKLVDTALIALTTGEVCPAEIRDYHRAMLIAPRSGASQTQNCQTVFAEDVARDNLRTLTALAAGYPWTATHDSLWRADTTVRPTLPLVQVSTRWFSNPMSGDTLVFGGGTDNNVSIAVYRERHPGFRWPS